MLRKKEKKREKKREKEGERREKGESTKNWEFIGARFLQSNKWGHDKLGKELPPFTACRKQTAHEIRRTGSKNERVIPKVTRIQIRCSNNFI